MIFQIKGEEEDEEESDRPHKGRFKAALTFNPCMASAYGSGGPQLHGTEVSHTQNMVRNAPGCG